MTDYANLNYPNNLPLKRELIRLIDLLNSNNIHYWVDFASLEKITNPSKYLNYLSAFEICVFENDYPAVQNIVRTGGFYVWHSTDESSIVSNPTLHVLKVNPDKFDETEIIIQSMLKWVIVWKYKLFDSNKTGLGMQKDYVYDKQLFLDTKEIEYCDIKLKIPSNIDLINKIRYSNAKGIVWCHSPKKRENCEKGFGFNNLENYK